MGILESDIERMKRNRDIQGLTRALTADNDRATRISACYALINIRDPRAVSAFISLIGDGDLQDLAIKGLTSIGEPALPELVTAIRDHKMDCISRKAVAEALTRLEVMPSDTMARLWIALIEEEWEVLASAGNQAIDPLISKLEYESAFYPYDKEAVRLLALIGSEAVERLIQSLDDRRLRKGVATTLGLIGDDRAVKPLIKCLDAEGTLRDTSLTIMRALGQIGDVSAIDSLIELACYAYTSEEAINAIKMILERNSHLVQEEILDHLAKLEELDTVAMIPVGDSDRMEIVKLDMRDMNELARKELKHRGSMI